MKQVTQIPFILAAIVFALAACHGLSPMPEALAQLVVTDTSEITATTQVSDQGIDVTFKTPEEAIAYYLDGIAQNDIRKILQACATNEMGENFKFDLSAERMGDVIIPNSLAPTDYSLYAEINKIQISSQILGQVKFFAYSLLSSEKVDGTTVYKMDAESVNSFIQDVDPSRLSSLEIKQINLPNETIMNDAKYIESTTKSARTYGADEFTERVALFSFEQNDYFIGFTLLRYGENWKISSQSSVLANTSPIGTAQKTTVEEFESIIDIH